MKITSTLRPLLCCLLLALLVNNNASAQRKRQVAVLDFNFNTVDIGLARKAFGNVQNLAQQISVKLSSRLTNLGTCHVIERQQLLQILREQRLGQVGVLDANTMARVGKVLGVDSVVLGNVTVFDIQGLPTRGERQSQWDPSEMSARLQVSFRVVDTTTAFIEMSQEATGSYAPQREKKSSTSKSKIFADILGGLGNRNIRSSEPQARATDEQVKGVVEGAVDDVVTKISASLENHFSNARERATESKAPANQINGTVVEVNQNRTVYIADVDKSLVRRGDRLYVRRGRKKVNPQTGKEYKFTEKIGEVEIVEIQDELVVGSFSGSLEVKEGDIVTNNESGAGLSPMIRSTQPAKEQPPNPGPDRNQNQQGPNPRPGYRPVPSLPPYGRRPVPTRP